MDASQTATQNHPKPCKKKLNAKLFQAQTQQCQRYSWIRALDHSARKSNFGSVMWDRTYKNRREDVQDQRTTDVLRFANCFTDRQTSHQMYASTTLKGKGNACKPSQANSLRTISPKKHILNDHDFKLMHCSILQPDFVVLILGLCALNIDKY